MKDTVTLNLQRYHELQNYEAMFKAMKEDTRVLVETTGGFLGTSRTYHVLSESESTKQIVDELKSTIANLDSRIDAKNRVINTLKDEMSALTKKPWWKW